MGSHSGSPLLARRRAGARHGVRPGRRAHSGSRQVDDGPGDRRRISGAPKISQATRRASRCAMLHWKGWAIACTLRLATCGRFRFQMEPSIWWSQASRSTIFDRMPIANERSSKVSACLNREAGWRSPTSALRRSMQMRCGRSAPQMWNAAGLGGDSGGATRSPPQPSSPLPKPWPECIESSCRNGPASIGLETIRSAQNSRNGRSRPGSCGLRAAEGAYRKL